MSSGHNTLVGNNSYDIFQYHFFKCPFIGTPANAECIILNNCLCWKITATTTFAINQYLPIKDINFVVVGGGRSPTKAGVAGGAGGGIVYGTINGTSTMTVTIGAGGAATSITAGVSNANININSLSGSSGTNIVLATSVAGGAGGAYSSVGNGGIGSDGYFIDSLKIYVSGGGGGGSSNSLGLGGNGGTGGGGHGRDNAGTNGANGTINTGGGGGGYAGGSNLIGGSGVVYFYI